MTKPDPDVEAKPAPPADRKAGREARLAQALRDNLRRRKATNSSDDDESGD